jgi:sec-independent protein translocase protein TatB
MLSLDPEKLFIVLVVALVLLGPDKLPKLARQLGAGWAKVRAFQQKMEEEVRESVPNLPSAQELARMARSPVAYLTSMAAASADDDLVPDPGATSAQPAEAWPVDPAAPPARGNGHVDTPPTLVRTAGIPEHQLPADPGMN